MPKDPLKVEESTQKDFYIGVVERPNPYISEQKIHERLGDIHKNRPKRLTDEEAEIIRKYKEWNLKDLPEDWQTKYNNLIKASEALGEWKKQFGDLTPPQVKTIYDQSKETHNPQDLKPDNLPADWETELNRIKVLEENAAKYKDYDTSKEI